MACLDDFLERMIPDALRKIAPQTPLAVVGTRAINVYLLAAHKTPSETQDWDVVTEGDPMALAAKVGEKSSGAGIPHCRSSDAPYARDGAVILLFSIPTVGPSHDQRMWGRVGRARRLPGS